MMREIKFRAWDKQENKMSPSFTLTDHFGDDDKGAYWPLTGSGPRDLETNRDIVMQYTGLKDKNGVEIYEGDIVRQDEQHYEIAWNVGDARLAPLVLYESNEPPYTHSSRVPLREWNWISCADTRDPDWRSKHEFVYGIYIHGQKNTGACEVIGNIYENPELLK